MKLKIATITAATLLISAYGAFASVTINLGADELFQSDGVTPIPVNSLLQLVVSETDNTFSTPTPSSFTGTSSDDVVLGSFAAQAGGSFLGAIQFTLAGNLNAGDQLLLRWYPSLTTASPTPGSGTSFGQFRTDNTENFSTTGWVVPADGATIDLNFFDQSSGIPGAAQPDSAGRAAFTTTAVPEPSTYVSALLGLGGIGLATLRRRFKK